MPVDPGAYVAPTAKVHPDALIGPGSRIGEFCVVESDVSIGPNCLLEPYVYVKRWTTMGSDNEISAGAVLGTDPLDKHFKGHRSYLRIGNGNKIREHYTISRGTAEDSETILGDGNYIMTSGHIAHNCVIGSNVVIASCALIAGYVEIGDQAFISGGIGVHQFSKIGRLAMVGGMSRVNKDLPPFFTYMGYQVAARGLNRVGLRRAGFSRDLIAEIKEAFRLLYRTELSLEAALAEIEIRLQSDAANEVVRFIRSSKRGIVRRASNDSGDESED
ncbi:MAG: acyl-ACP--UDP-N-acetylglucosamine O-acyltransferase [Candidatus Solibacter sp.]|nr:acyl-ACP--UDP-N-acetylglucosamine O-acyltransferase [Candidatus Solibacter sp.]